MKTEIKNTSAYKRKLNKLPGADQKQVGDHIKKLIFSIQNGKTFFSKHTSQPYHFALKHQLDSSLYSSRVSKNLRLILSIDEDPIFNKMDVNLFDIINKSEEEKVFKQVGENIYRSEYLMN